MIIKSHKRDNKEFKFIKMFDDNNVVSSEQLVTQLREDNPTNEIKLLTSLTYEDKKDMVGFYDGLVYDYYEQCYIDGSIEYSFESLLKSLSITTKNNWIVWKM
jgi:hypothetical protein